MKNTKLKLVSFMVIGAAFLSFNYAFAGEVDQRLDNQQQRIDNGVASGKMTQAQANHLDARDARINAARKRDLRAHGGKLTPAERRRLNRRENRVSRRIYHDKHDAASAPSN